MVEWISNNKEWLFSGVGWGIVFLVGSWINKKIKSRKIKEPSLNGASIQDIIDAPLPPPKKEPDIKATSLTPKKIFEDINSAPILQRPEMKKHYEGVAVSWTGTLSGAEKINENKIQLRIKAYTDKAWTSINKAFMVVFFYVNPDKYPGIGLLREGHKILVEGKIERIEEAWIVLDAEKIEYNIDDLD